ncbi:MAG: sulfur carrier protein ThiS [Actinomycetota bacterium]|jgi:sulfur carrier protein|nr:sulfur carrier protein ThiS [Actinomycetota bacterium]
MNVVHAVVNGVPRELPRGTTIDDIVAELCPSRSGIAVALDDDVVPRSRWATTSVETGQRVEVVTATAGG